MSAARIQLITILCLFSTALSGPESGGVVWKDPGGSITIQCTATTKDHEHLSLEKGLTPSDQILYKDKDSNQEVKATGFKDRLQLHGQFHNLSIYIKNLTAADTGLYWCIYSMYNPKAGQVQKECKASLLLVVRESPRHCDPSDKNLVLLSVVISAAILLGIIIGFLIWIVLKTKAMRSARSTAKPRRTAANDVYEDMRGTMRH
ncbi:hypothetical protein GBF38_023146 [Nibea albiflora]|uniref:Uncharacterized protein n=1 Tax=Nibea albiflora TaxID=240163 RepID=A0ACB7EXR4_NIBAL|nr:hypothetical protein GBF38_023146 [Nibea albiflora]